MNNTVLYAADQICVEYFPATAGEGRDLAFVFSPFGHHRLDGNPYGGSLLTKNGYDVVSVKISRDDWFQTLPECVFDSIDRLAARKNYARRVSYGMSMGGFGAIVFAKRLNLDIAFALAPQYSIRQPFDRRTISEKIEWKYEINKETISDRCIFLIVYDHKSIDNLHVEFLHHIIPNGNLRKYRVRHCDHFVWFYLQQLGTLKAVVLSGLNTGSIPRPLLMKNRRNSPIYMGSLARAAERRNHPNWALNLLEMAHIANPVDHETCRSQGALLERLGRAPEILDLARRATARNPGDPHIRYYAYEVFQRAGLTAEAIEQVKLAIEFSDQASRHPLENLCAVLLLGAGDLGGALAFCDRAIHACPEAAAYQATRAQVLAAAGRTGPALEAARRALVLEGDNPHYLSLVERLSRLARAPAARG